MSGLPLRLLPGLFVLLWSTGFIGARLGMPHAEPMTFLALRFALTAACLMAGALLWRAAWPSRPAEWGHLAVAGLLMHGIYLGGVFVAIRLGLEAGLSALIVSLQPLLVAAAAPFLLALLLETRHIEWVPELVFALLWLVVVLSLGAIPLLYLLLRRGAASQVASLFFLVPPTTALIAWPLFGERLGPIELAGMVLTVAGVALVNSKRP